jgi:hypothetical protein
MTDQELSAYAGKAVRVTLADGQILAGTLHVEHDHGHGHVHYAVVSDAVRQGGEPVRAVLHGADRVTSVEDASSDPAAVE